MQSAVLDACVLYPAPLRDFFMRLTVKLYLDRTRDLMNRYGGACLVTGYEQLIPTLILPDEGDRHVLAAAITATAPIIVTFNLKDFPNRVLAQYSIRAVHPDVFATALYDTQPEPFIALVKAHRKALVNPPKSAEDYLETLNGCGLKKTVERLQSHLSTI